MESSNTGAETKGTDSSSCFASCSRVISTKATPSNIGQTEKEGIKTHEDGKRECYRNGCSSAPKRKKSKHAQTPDCHQCSIVCWTCFKEGDSHFLLHGFYVPLEKPILVEGHSSQVLSNYCFVMDYNFIMSFQVYTRLSKLGVSTTHKTALQAVKKLGRNHDAQVISWKKVAQPEPDYIIVGDNIDKNVTPRDMRVGNQVKSLHYFHSYAVKDRVDPGSLSGDGHVSDVNTLATSSVLPTVDDCVRIRNDYIILAARVIVENISHFSFLQKCVVKHIPHKFSKETARKSVIVSKIVSQTSIFLIHGFLFLFLSQRLPASVYIKYFHHM